MAISLDLERTLVELDPGYAAFIRSFARMDKAEAASYLATEFSYMGRYKDEAFLIFYDQRCCARDTLALPNNRTYRVELIDIWNMSRDVIAKHVCGKTDIYLPAKEDMAVLVLADGE